MQNSGSQTTECVVTGYIHSYLANAVFGWDFVFQSGLAVQSALGQKGKAGAHARWQGLRLGEAAQLSRVQGA